MARFLIIFTFVVLCCLQNILGATFSSQLEAELTEYGTITKFCRHGGMKFGIGSKIKDMDSCKKCSCTKGGLRCSDMTGVVTVGDENPQCKNVVVGCRNRWVRVNKPTKKCPRKLMPKKIGMIGK